MSIDGPQKDKMMKAPPVKKGWHFASDGIHYAEFVEAETIQEAEAIYHKIKRLLISPPTDASSTPLPPEPPNGTVQ